MFNTNLHMQNCKQNQYIFFQTIRSKTELNLLRIITLNHLVNEDDILFSILFLNKNPNYIVILDHPH